MSRDVAQQELFSQPQRWNTYSYALNNPVVYTDPDGRWVTKLLGKLAWPLTILGEIFDAPAAGGYIPPPGPELKENRQQCSTSRCGTWSPNAPGLEKSPPQAPLQSTSTIEQNSVTIPSGLAPGAAHTTNFDNNFGKLGKLVDNKAGKITGYTEHGLNQKINRSVFSSVINKTVKDPKAVLEQAGGNKLYLGNEAAVVLNRGGKVVTTYGQDLFKTTIKYILKVVK